MTREELRNWLAEELERLQAMHYWANATWVNIHYADRWNEQHEEAVDRSIEHLLQTGDWGDLARDERSPLYYRLVWARDFLESQIRARGRPRKIIPAPMADADQIKRWLLLSQWKSQRRRVRSGKRARRPPTH
jgi:hypothetical protein